MKMPDVPNLVIWLILVAIAVYAAWWMTRSVGETIPAGGLNNGKSLPES